MPSPTPGFRNDIRELCRARHRRGFLLRLAKNFFEKKLSFQNKCFQFLCSFFSKKFSRLVTLSPTGLLKKFLEVNFTPKKYFFWKFFSLRILGDQIWPSTGRTCKIPTFENSLQGSFKWSQHNNLRENWNDILTMSKY